MGDHELLSDDEQTSETEEEQEGETTPEESQSESKGLGHPEMGWPAFEDR